MSDVTIVIKAQNQAQAAMQAVKGDLEQIGRTAGGLKQQLANAAAEMRNVGMGLTAGVTLPVVGIAAAAINSAAQFEQSLNVMQQVSGATEAQMASMQAQALQLGAETAFSAGEAAAGMLELAKAGLNTDQVMAAIGGTMDLAAAGNLDLAAAAEIAANAVNTFGLGADETVAVADMLAAAANASSVEVGDLAQGMKMAGSVFAASGQNIDDLTTAMALMGNAGIKGSDAGTSLKTMLMRLSAPTDEAIKVLDQLGVSMYNLDGSARALPDVMADLGAATSGMSDETRAMALTTLFGADAIRAANVLVAKGPAGWKAMAKAVGASGAATEVANARMRGMAGAIEYAKGSLDSFLIGSALPFLDTLGGIVRQAADAITWFGALDPAVKNAALAFTAVLAAAGPVLLALSGIATAIGFLLSPIGLVVVGLAALAAAWTMNFGGIQEITAQAWTAIQAFFEGVFDYVGGIGDALRTGSFSWDDLIPKLDWSGYISDFGEWSKYIGALAWNSFVSALTWAGTFIKALDWGAFVSALTWAGTFVKALDWGSFVSTLGDWAIYVKTLAWDGFVSILKWDAFVLSFVWDNFIVPIDWGGFVTALGDWSMYVGKLAWDSFILALDWSVGFIKALDWGAFVSALGDWSVYVGQLTWSGFVRTLDWTSGYITSLDWGGFVTALSDWTAYVTALAWSSFVTVLDWAVYAGGFAWNQVLTVLPWADYIPALDMATVTTAFDQITAAMQSVSTTWETTWSGLQETASAAWTQLEALLGPALTRLQEAFAKAQTDVGALGPKFTELMTAVQNMWTAVQPVLEAFGAFVAGTLVVVGVLGVNLLAQAFSAMGTVVGAVLDQITLTINTFSAIVGEVVTAVKAVLAGDWATAWQSAQNIVGAFGSYLLGTFANLGLIVGTIFVAIKAAVLNTLSDLGIDGQAILTGIQVWWDGIWLSLAEKVKPVTDGVDAAKAAITSFQEWVGTFTLPDATAGWSFLDLQTWDWPDFPTIPGIVETLTAWQWPGFPELPAIVSTLVKWVWPGFPGMPGWLDALLSWDWPTPPAILQSAGAAVQGATNAVAGAAGSAGAAAGNAWGAAGAAAGNAWGAAGDFFNGPNQQLGTSYYAGGPTWVGEAGRELLIPPRGSQIVPNREAERLAGAVDRVAVTVQQMIVRDDKDIYALAYQVADILARG